MSYTRGHVYIWQDGTDIHIWSRNGYDGWDESVWGNADESIRVGDVQPSGIGVSFEIIDEFAAMRVAQLIDELKLSEAVDRAIRKWQGNGGCGSLIHLQNRIKGIESGNEDSKNERGIRTRGAYRKIADVVVWVLCVFQKSEQKMVRIS